MSLRQDKSDVSHLGCPIGSLVHFIHNERMRKGRMGSTKGIFHGILPSGELSHNELENPPIF
jgi:hypothetical protein